MRSSVDIRRMIVGVVAVCVFGTAVFGQPWAGSGTAEDPYQIWDACDMQAIGVVSNYWDAHFILCADIDLEAYTGTSFNIIGTYPSEPFTGVFDGNGHTISNFDYNSTDASYLGLFGYVDEPNVIIKDLKLIDPNINAINAVYGSSIGSLVGYLKKGTVAGCYVDGGRVAGYNVGRLGGLVGTNSGIISDSYSKSAVSGGSSIGGLVGFNSYGQIFNSYSAGMVSGSYEIGGLVGFSYPDKIYNSYSTGDVYGDESVGGLVGRSEGKILNCYATGNTGAEGKFVGGLVGIQVGTGYPAKICSSYATGAVSGHEYVGGLVGSNNGPILDSYSMGRVSGYMYVGGLVAHNYCTNISNCYSKGVVSGNFYAGGLVGHKYAGSVNNSFWDIETSGKTSSAAGTGKTTAEMQTESTFTDAGWDFVGEVINGPNDIWTICEGADYPKLTWQFVTGDFDGDDDIDFVDFDMFAAHWLEADSSFYCGGGGTDLTNDGQVGLNDLREFTEHWLAGR